MIGKGANQNRDRLRRTELAFSKETVLLPLNFAHSYRIDVHDIVRAGMQAPIKALTRMKACFGCIKSDQ